MSKSQKTLSKVEQTPINWLMGSLVVITLYFQPNLADPFNSPKLWILITASAWLSGYVFSYRALILKNSQLKYLTLILFLFLLSLFISTLFTDFKYVAVFGDTQRRNGFLQYFSLAIVLLVSAMYVRFQYIKKLYFVTYFIATVIFTYSLMQTTGNDFVAWNNPYNPVIATLGNPNFAAAAMAIMGVLIFATAFNNDFRNTTRIFAVVLVFLLIFMIYKSNARQGLLAIILGIGIFTTFWVWNQSKKIGVIVVILGGFLAVVAILGMLQVGPLEKYLYKQSVSIRGFYWRAGLEMFANHPLTGVGIDRYGSYFKEFREVNYPLNYGFEITSTNAHNTFIQFFATGGLFLGATYLVLCGYVLKRAVYGIKNTSGNKKMHLVGVFSAWVAFHAQSLISIDNIGLSIWGWVLAGTLVGLSLSIDESSNDQSVHSKVRNNKNSLNQNVISSVSTIMTAILVLLLYRGESDSLNGSKQINLQDPSARLYFKEFQLRIIDTPLNDPTYKLLAADRLIQAGFQEGLLEAENLSRNDPRNLDALNLLAQISKQMNEIEKAIKYRIDISALDEFNALNYLELGRLYKIQGNQPQSQYMLDKILSFASKHPIADEARRELGS